MAGNLVKPLLSLYGTEWRERGHGLWKISEDHWSGVHDTPHTTGKVVVGRCTLAMILSYFPTLVVFWNRLQKLLHLKCVMDNVQSAWAFCPSAHTEYKLEAEHTVVPGILSIS